MNVVNPSKRKRPLALVTGSQGFTGHYVTAELRSAGYDVVGISHQAADSVLAADLCDREAIMQAVASIQPDVVVHLAAIAFVAHGDVESIYRTNVLGTRYLLEALAATEHKPRAVLLASSANVYGNSEVELLTEEVPPAPANDYAVSKLAMEYMAKLWRDRLPIILARPFNYTGVGQSEKFLLPKIVSHFRRGAKVIELGNIDVARDFLDVRFIANAYRRLLQANAVGQVINLCSGKAYALKDVIQIMEDIAGYQIEVRVNPAFVRENEVARLLGSNQRLTSVIGKLEMVELRETLRWMYSAPLA